MIEQIDGNAAATSTVDSEWFEAHRTTPEEQEALAWRDERTAEVEGNHKVKQTLGLEYEAYRTQLESLSRDERLELIDKSAEEIAAHLDARAEADREQKELEKQAKQQAAENFEAMETPHLREVRKAFKAAYKEVASLDERIAELQRINELRNDPSAEGWDDLSTERWRAAREGKMESLDGEIATLIQEKQAKLQEASLHQNAYHEESRSIRPQSVSDRPIGQIVGNDGQPMQLTQADITALVQLELDGQVHEQRKLEASKRYPDYEQAVRNTVAAGVDVRPEQAIFIRTLPNSADVTYYLNTHHDETRAIARMNSHDAMRALINISHKTTRQSSPDANRTTRAPKPPSPVSGSSRGDWDVNDEGGSADEWMNRRNADLKRRGKL